MIICIIIIILLIITILSLIIYNKKKIDETQKTLYNNIQQKVEQDFIEKRRQELEEYLLIETANVRERADLSHQAHMAELRAEQQRLEGIIKTGEETIRLLEARRKEQADIAEEQLKLLEARENEKLIALKRQHEEQITSTKEQLKLLEQQREEQTKLIEATISDKKKIVDVEVQAYREVETQKAATAITQWAATARSQEEANLCLYRDEVAQSKFKLQEELARTQQEIDAAKAELADYKKKQDAVNEAILRQRELEEKQDFYRVCLSDSTIEDITLLQEIRQKLHTSESLNKLIYDVYVSKAVQEMVKRVLQGGAPSGIYKITRIKTGEIYIGKSTNVKDRWQQHCKTVFGAGTIAHSILHTTMQKDGLQNFTFELVEEVPKEKLTEREKYWIDFYGSKKYGLNEKNG